MPETGRRARAMGSLPATALTSVMALVLVVAGSGTASAAALWTWLPGPFACSAANNSCVSATGFDPTVSTWQQSVNPLGNCTNYVAYRLSRNGAVQLAGRGDAATWKTRVQTQFGATAVTSTPTVGSVAWWAGTATNASGHVAYVEQVSGSTIYVTESSWGKGSGRRVLTSGQAGWPGAFLHIKDAPTTRPDKPTNLSVTGTTGTTASLAWTDASSNEATFVTRYRIGTADWVSGPSVAANATRVVIGGLARGTTYTFQVGARNVVGTGWSGLASGTTFTLPGMPTDARVTSTTTSSVVLAWTDASSNETQFVTQYRIGTGPWVAGPSALADSTSSIVPGLAAGTAYTFQVGSRNPAGTTWSADADGATAAP